MRKSTVAAVFTAAVTIACAGDTMPGYVGTWKLNLAESDFGQLTMMIDTSMGGFKATMDGQSYTFTLDGAQHSTPWGNTIAWKGIDATTFEQVSWVNDKLAATDTIRISPDNMTLTIASNIVMPTGGSRVDTLTLSRTAGTSGLTGTWQTKQMNSSAPGTMEIALGPADELMLNFIEIQGECHAKADGSDSPATGPMWPSGWTCAVSNRTDTGFDLALKKDGNPMYNSTYSVSADGAKLTETGGAVTTTEKVTAVYDKQG